MPEKPFVPPTRKPVSEFPTPSHAVAFYTELVNRDDPAYMANAPVKRGSRYSTMVGAKHDVIATYPDLFFLQEQKYQLNDQLVLWHWATDENASDTYNADVTYVANAVTYPAFTRVYTVRRDLYEAQPVLQIGSPLPGIIAVEITSPGQNHTEARGVINGTSVAIDFVVDSNGSLVSAVITNTGNELIQNGTAITIIGDGQDSSAIAVTQPVGCVMTAQKKEELPQDDPTQHELVRVTRVYETLPGPWIYSTRIDKDGMLVTLKTRRQVADFIDDDDEILLSGTGSIWVQTWHKEVDDFVAEENVESRPLPGNPILDTRIEEDGMVMTITKTLIDVTTGISNETLVSGVWAKRRIEEIASTTFVKDTQASNKVAWQIVESRPIPGNPMVDTRLDEDGMVITITKILADASLIDSGEVIVGSFWVKTHEEAVSDLVAYQVQEVRELPGNLIHSTKIDEDGVTIFISRRLRQYVNIVSSEEVSGGFWTKVNAETINGVEDLVAWEVTTTRRVPGNSMLSTRVDDDGMEVDVTKVLRETVTIVTQETLIAGVWTHEHVEAVSDLVAWDVTEVRAIPGNPMETTRIDDDGRVVHINTTLRDATLINDGETLIAGSWRKVTQKAVSELVGQEIVETRVIPGNPVPSTRLDEDGVKVDLVTTLKDTTLITTSETLVLGVWTKTNKKAVSDLVAEEIVETRSIPGNPIPDSEVDKDGIAIDIVRTMKAAIAITTQEQIIGGIWTRTEADPITDLISWEKVTARLVPGNVIPSANVDQDHEIVTISNVLRDSSTITPGASEAGGFITTVEQKEVTDLVSEEITTVKRFLDAASYSISIVNIIPREFMAFIPTFVESHIYAGIASMPVLALGEFEHSQKQLTRLLYEDRITSLGPISLPITHTNKETTEEYGGGVLNVILTLDVTGVQTIDEGYLVTSSNLTVLGNGMDLKETKSLNSVSWPQLTSNLWDDNMRLEYIETQQVVPFGSLPDPDPGGATFAWTSEIRKLDIWRVVKVNVNKPAPIYTDEATALISYEFRPFRFPGLIYFAGAGYFIRSADARLTQVLVKTWWVKASSPPPVPTVDEIIVDDPIISSLNDTTQLQYAGPCIHDDLLTFGVLFFPATTPSWTDYTTNWIGNYKIIGASVTPEKERDLWKYQTQSIVMH
jgi:hypothetical protein